MTPDGQELQTRPLVNVPASLLEYLYLLWPIIKVFDAESDDHIAKNRMWTQRCCATNKWFCHSVWGHYPPHCFGKPSCIFPKQWLQSPTTICRILATRANAVKEPSLFQSFLACLSRQCEEYICLFVWRYIFWLDR